MEAKKLQSLPQEVKDAIRQTNLAYLYDREEAIPYCLADDSRVSTNGCLLKGEFIRCLQGSQILPARTSGWLFEERAYTYDKYVWVGDMQYPAKGAKQFHKGTHYTWITLVELTEETKVIGSCYKFIEYPEPRFVGTI